jgi:hypothetical protein
MEATKGFEFFFTLYGLILGLAVTEVLGGFARVAKQRHRVRLGYITPMLGLLTLVDLTSFWRGAWERLRGAEVTLPLLLTGLAIAGVYFLAASLIIPDDFEDWPSLDAFFNKHKGWVMGGVLTANLLNEFVITALISTPVDYAVRMLSLRHIVISAIYIGLVCGVAFFRNHKVNAGFLVAMLAMYFLA